MHHTVLRRWRTLLAALACGFLLSCGGGGGPSGGQSGASANLANICTLAGEKSFVRAYMGENYYWYNEIPAINANLFGSAADYFLSLRVRTPDANGLPKDQFSFVASVANADSFESGIIASFGVDWTGDGLPGSRVAQVVPNSPASRAGMARGGLLDSIDFTFTDADSWYPNRLARIRFGYRDTPSASPRTVTLNAEELTLNPVPLVSVVNTSASHTVGYVLFNDHSGAAQDKLITAIGALRTSNISDLVLDMRYNGGGFLYVAQTLASMVTGPANDNKVFERLQFNNKRAADSAAFVFPFSSTVDFSDGFTPVGAPLPRLSLPRVYVLTSDWTCSASESVVNGLRGVDVQVVLIGQSTCGKPYGFTRRDNCGLALFPIEFEGFNAKGTGGYTAGLAPTCTVADDVDHALGDVNEGQLAAALHHMDTGVCLPSAAAARSPTQTALATVRRSALGGGAASGDMNRAQRPGKLLVGGAR